MNGGATIFDDRETVELLCDHPQLLAIADAVRATQGERTRSARPLVMATIGLIAAAAVGFGVSTLFQGSGHQASGPTAPVQPGGYGSTPPR